jgi:hypothetical protein
MKNSTQYKTYRLAVLTSAGEYYLTNNLRRAVARTRQLRNAGLDPAIYVGEYGDSGVCPIQYGQVEEIKEVRHA